MSKEKDKTPPETTPTGAATSAEPAKKTRGLDPELQVMAKIDRLLGDLNESQVARVLAWLVARSTSGRFRIIVGTDDVLPKMNGVAT